MTDMVNNLFEKTINILVLSKAMYVIALGLVFWVAKTVDYDKLEQTAFKLGLILALLYCTYKIEKDLENNCPHIEEKETRVETLGETMIETHCNPDGTCTIYREDAQEEPEIPIEDEQEIAGADPIEEPVINE
jgi:hypothetical protein